MASSVHTLHSAHCEEIRAVASQCFPKVWTVEEYRYFVTHPQGYVLGIRDESHELSAFLIALLVEGELDVISIASRPDHQRKGFASQLLRTAIDDSRVTKISLEVRDDNRAALGLYQKLGFHQVGRRRKYYEGKQDALVLIFER